MFSTMEPLFLSLPGARADRKPSTPPALPIKQRRSQSSSTSSAPDLQLDGSILNLSASSPLASPFIDVFAVTVDCNAPECPIHHQRYGTPGYHQERFFSDQPPPVPKKRLVRTLSLPANTHCNMIPTPNSDCNVKISPIEYAGETKNDVQQFSSFNQLNFDTSDEDLQNLLSLWHQERVCEAIQDFYLRFLKKATSHMEASVLLKEQEVEMIKALHSQDLMLCENPQPEKKQSDYFLVNFPKVSEVFLSAKVSRRGYAPTCPTSMPCHPNIEDTVAHFSPGMAQETQLSHSLTSAMTSKMSHEGSTELYHESGITSKEPTVLCFLKTGFTVTIVRDFPWATLEDFVQERISQHCSQPDVYERRLCLLMLQLFLGLQHLETHNAKPAELRAGTIMLVWSQIQNRQLTEKERFDENPRVTKEKAKSVHALWEKWGTPRVVISPSNLPADATSKDVLHSRLQMSSILKFCLHQQREIHQTTQYTSGLIYLTNQLSCEDSEIQTSDIAGILQALLWGPRAGLFEKNQANTTVIHNWLMVKRSLLVLKLAGKGLVLNQCGLDWEDPLCLQYFSHTDSDRILRTTAHLGLHCKV